MAATPKDAGGIFLPYLTKSRANYLNSSSSNRIPDVLTPPVWKRRIFLHGRAPRRRCSPAARRIFPVAKFSESMRNRFENLSIKFRPNRRTNSEIKNENRELA
uniref:Uncharacterized protein n=1 Tax=Photinus pyralis TaxID=7054 RepID=A0A1Y1LNF1_PHOPY